LTSQLRRTAISIPSNIAEGQGRNSSKEFCQFLGIAMGSMAELETQLIIATEIDYMTSMELEHFQSNIDTIRKMTKSLAKNL
jgi:four helix bundle protein